MLLDASGDGSTWRRGSCCVLLEVRVEGRASLDVVRKAVLVVGGVARRLFLASSARYLRGCFVALKPVWAPDAGPLDRVVKLGVSRRQLHALDLL